MGLSTRAIRHYHRVGLLPEPARRANGYREYSLRDAVELAHVRRLTELGLSLDEVGDALAGDAGRDLVEILRELDGDLARQENDLRQRRPGWPGCCGRPRRATSCRSTRRSRPNWPGCLTAWPASPRSGPGRSRRCRRRTAS